MMRWRIGNEVYCGISWLAEILSGLSGKILHEADKFKKHINFCVDIIFMSKNSVHLSQNKFLFSY